MDSIFGNLPAILALLIPIVAVAGWYGYSAVERWHDIEEKRLAMQAANGGAEVQQQVQRLEREFTGMQTELVERVRDMDDRLARIEILLSEVE